jgi:alpha-tubulin suppressor-like RCC1 family protein
MYGFGSNVKGQLGIGQTSQETYSTPQRIQYQHARMEACSSSAYPSALACGHSFTAMILDGRVFTWGCNQKGQCGIGSISPSIWTPTMTSLPENIFVTNISCGLDHALAITGL